MFFDALRFFSPSCLGARRAGGRQAPLRGRPCLEALEDRDLPAHAGPGLPNPGLPDLAKDRGAVHGTFPAPHGEGNGRPDHHLFSHDEREDAGFGRGTREDEAAGRRTFQGEGRGGRSRAALSLEQAETPGPGAEEFAAGAGAGAALQFASAPGRVAAETAVPAALPEDDSSLGALFGQPAGVRPEPGEQEAPENLAGGSSAGTAAVFFTSLGGLSPNTFGGASDPFDLPREGSVEGLPALNGDVGPAWWGPEPLSAPDLAAGLLPGGEPRPDILPPDGPRAAPVVTLLGWEAAGDKLADAPSADRAIQDLFIDPLGAFGEAQEVPPPAPAGPDSQTSAFGLGRTLRAAALAGALLLGVALFAQQEAGRTGRQRRGGERPDWS
jgi:hypothetical protein